jgi:hypothetical protein
MIQSFMIGSLRDGDEACGENEKAAKDRGLGKNRTGEARKYSI